MNLLELLIQPWEGGGILGLSDSQNKVSLILTILRLLLFFFLLNVIFFLFILLLVIILYIFLIIIEFIAELIRVIRIDLVVVLGRLSSVSEILESLEVVGLKSSVDKYANVFHENFFLLDSA